MTHVLPEAVIRTVAGAMELSVLSHDLDRRMLERLAARSLLSVAAYCDAFRALANREERERQIALIVETGRALDRYVNKPLLGTTRAANFSRARLHCLRAHGRSPRVSYHDSVARDGAAERDLCGRSRAF